MRAAGFLGLCLVGCATPSAPPPNPSSEAHTGIAEGNRLLTAAVLVGSGDRVATVFADDATLLDPALPGAVHGHVAIAEYWRTRLARTRFLEAELTTTDVSVSGDLAYEVGTSRARTQVGDLPPVLSTGRYLAVWRLGPGGRWRIQADCFIPDPTPP